MAERLRRTEVSVRPGSLVHVFLQDCITSDPRDAELFLLGSSRMVEAARAEIDRYCQAILPVDQLECGADIEEMFDNECCKALIACIGVGIVLDPDTSHTFDLNRIRYRRLFLVTGDDVDGQKNKSEVLRLLWTYMRPVVKEGLVYVPESPLPMDFTDEQFASQILRRATRRFRVVQVGECE